MPENKTAADKYRLRVCLTESMNILRFRYILFVGAIMFICGLRAHVRAIERGLGVWDMEHETHNMDMEHGTWSKVFLYTRGKLHARSSGASCRRRYTRSKARYPIYSPLCPLDPSLAFACCGNADGFPARLVQIWKEEII